MPPQTNGTSSNRRHTPAPSGEVEVPFGNGLGVGNNNYEGPVDLDELFTSSRNIMEKKDAEEDSLFADDDTEDDEYMKLHGPEVKYFNNPHKRLLDNDASLIPGSPFSKPAIKRSNRPSEPLAMAKVCHSFV
jgi:hypothetical protein